MLRKKGGKSNIFDQQMNTAWKLRRLKRPSLGGRTLSASWKRVSLSAGDEDAAWDLKWAFATRWVSLLTIILIYIQFDLLKIFWTDKIFFVTAIPLTQFPAPFDKRTIGNCHRSWSSRITECTMSRWCPVDFTKTISRWPLPFCLAMFSELKWGTQSQY